jgi:hypothetical protein
MKIGKYWEELCLRVERQYVLIARGFYCKLQKKSHGNYKNSTFKDIGKLGKQQ